MLAGLAWLSDSERVATGYENLAIRTADRRPWAHASHASLARSILCQYNVLVAIPRGIPSRNRMHHQYVVLTRAETIQS